MTLKLVVTTNVNGDVFELVLKNAKYGVGRRHDNDLRIKETYISGYHAELTRTESGAYVLSDLGSSNGTFLNGRRVDGKETIAAGDFIKFGILKVAVQEHTDTMPKIVSLKDRLAFAPKDESNTASIAVERKTGPVASMEAISVKGETQPTVTSAAPQKEIQDLNARLNAEKLRVAKLQEQIDSQSNKSTALEKDLEALREELKSRDVQLKALSAGANTNETLAKELTALTSELAETKKSSRELESELKRFQSEADSASRLLTDKKTEEQRLVGELNSLKKVLSETEAREQKSREEIAASAVTRDEIIQRLNSEIQSLKEVVDTKDGDLKATAKEAAKIAALKAASEKDLSGLASDLESTKNLAEKERVKLEEALDAKTAELESQRGELSSLQEKIDALTAAAERDKSGLASELESTKTLSERERIKLEQELNAKAVELESQRGELSSLQEKIDALTAAAEKDKSGLASELESTKTLSERGRIMLEQELNAKTVELESQRGELSSLQEKIDALTAAAERDKSGLASELESTKTLSERERIKLEQELNAKAVELESQRGELSSLQEKIDALTAAAERDKSGLASELESTKTLSERERIKLEQELNAKAVELESQRGELSSLQEKIDALTAAAEKDKSGLSSQLAAAIIAAGTIKSELSTLKAETAGERKERLAALKNLEKENAKLCKSRESAEATLAKQTEQIATLKATLNEKNKEVTSAAGEAKKAGKIAKELEALKSELESTRGTLEAAALREKASLGELEETNRRVNALDIQLKSNAAENERLRESLETQTTLAASGRAEAERLSLELEKISAESSAKSAEEVAKLQEEIAVLNTRVNETSVEISRTNKQLEEAQRLVGSSEIERASLRSELAELLSSGTNAVREASEVRARLKILEAEHLEVQEQLKSQITALQAAKAEANDLRVDLRKNKESSEQSLGEIEKTLKSRIAELETSLGSERVRAGDLLSQNEEHKSNLVNLGKNLDTLREEADQLKTRNEETSRNNGRLQAELNRESAERAQISEELETARTRSNQLVKEVEDLKQSLSGKDREMAEREQHYSRSESDMVQKLKRELGESVTARDASEEKAAKAIKEKLSLSSAFERLKEQLDQAESANRKAKEVEEEMNHSKGLLARRLEKAEASNSELAARIKEESMALIASRTLIAKLETELRENESEAVRREHEQVVTLQADISQRQRKSAEAERLRSQLEGELNLTKEAKRQADERILALSERILEMESETLSTRNLLTDTEKKRGELSSRLAEESALAESHAKAVEALRTDLADTIARFKSSEAELLSKHANETDELLAELRSERGHKEGLEVELSNTRIGMSEALRKAREESAAAQAKLIADGNAKLSAAEDNLSEVIRSREEIELSRNGLEDELNLRDGQIEKLSERIEDLEIHLRDEIEARHKVLKDFQTTKEGFSKALHANWNHLGSARSTLDKEKTFRGESEAALTTAKEEIARLIATAKEQDQRYHSELRDWEQRYETLREEKLTLASEDANLNKIREQILEATTKKKTIDAELSSLSSGMKDFQLRHRELQAQKDALLREREELKAGLNVARSELDSVQMRCNESKDQESKLTDTITAAERRIQSLRKLESEMEQAVERKRQQNILSRGDVFSGQVEALTTSGDFSREDFYRKLITKLDLLDDLTKRYDNKWRYPKVAEQLAILKRSFVDFLHDHSVKQFDLEPGTVLSVAERKRIKLVPLQNGAPKNPVTNGKGSTSHNSLVVETLRPGYVYQDGSKDVIIRKAEVVVS